MPETCSAGWWRRTGTPVVVGARAEDSSPGMAGADNSSMDSGAVYVFVQGEDGSWKEEALLKASNAGAGDWFGGSLAISGDIVVVGAPLEDGGFRNGSAREDDNTARNSGAAYVFVRSGNTWRQEAYLKASNLEANDEFGHAVAVSGSTVVVSAYKEDSGTADPGDDSAETAGAAYVFVRDDPGVWRQQAFLKADTIVENDAFGYSVAISGERIAVGVAFADSVDASEGTNRSRRNSGAVAIFHRDQGNRWSREAWLEPDEPGAEDAFGWSVALDGDTLVAGAPLGDGPENRLTSSGSACVFARQGGTWSQQARLRRNEARADDQFGSAVAVHEGTVVVGAYGVDQLPSQAEKDAAEARAALQSGAVFTFRQDGGAWRQVQQLTATWADSEDKLGFAVGVSERLIAAGAFTGDSASRSINGDISDNGARDSGVVLIFDRSEMK